MASDESVGMVEAKVLGLVSETLAVPAESVHLGSRIEELAEDSIALFGLVTAFENEFGMQAEYEELMSIDTVADIVKLIGKKRGQ